jgi:hypothetical protein
MGELLRRGFDAQLADRNTKGYDLLMGQSADAQLSKVQVKTVRAQPWYVRLPDYKDHPDQITVYVLLGDESAEDPVRYFIAKNSELAAAVTRPNWRDQKQGKDRGFVNIKALVQYEDRWDVLKTVRTERP